MRGGFGSCVVVHVHRLEGRLALRCLFVSVCVESHHRRDVCVAVYDSFLLVV